jgi:hypothetical protein
MLGLVLICDIAVGSAAVECTPDRAVFTGDVPGRWSDEAACQRGAVAYLHRLDVETILEPEHDYAITVTCRHEGLF